MFMNLTQGEFIAFLIGFFAGVCTKIGLYFVNLVLKPIKSRLRWRRYRKQRRKRLKNITDYSKLTNAELEEIING